MRTIKYIAVHCTASPQSWGVSELEHEFYKVKKWKNPGYHYVITTDGMSFPKITCQFLPD